jgi:alkyl hydroperoxide reductase subunit AhpF
MALLTAEVAEQTRGILAAMREPVEVALVTRAEGCPLCGPVAALLAELGALAPLLRVETLDLAADAGRVAALGVGEAPAMALRRGGEGRWPVRYFGLPAGMEFGAFLRVLTLLSAGTAAPGVDAAAVAAIGRPLRLRLFVLASCPRCPDAVWLCASIAAASPQVTLEVYEAGAFPDLARASGVATTPTLVVGDALSLTEPFTPAELIARLATA